VARKLLDSLRPAMHLRRRELRISASIGIALCPEDGTHPGALMCAADAAMYRAKEEGRNAFRFFTVPMADAATRRLGLENALVEALERDEFLFHYQPKID